MVVRNVVNEASEAEIDRIFSALADSTRRDILRRTIESEQSVSALAQAYQMSFAAVQKHVAVLAAAHLIVKRAEGRRRLVRTNPATIALAQRLMQRYQQLWQQRVAGIDALLAEDPLPPDPYERPSLGGTHAGHRNHQ